MAFDFDPRQLFAKSTPEDEPVDEEGEPEQVVFPVTEELPVDWHREPAE